MENRIALFKLTDGEEPRSEDDDFLGVTLLVHKARSEPAARRIYDEAMSCIRDAGVKPHALVRIGHEPCTNVRAEQSIAKPQFFLRNCLIGVVGVLVLLQNKCRHRCSTSSSHVAPTSPDNPRVSPVRCAGVC